MPANSKTLRSSSALVEAQLIKPARLDALQNVASRYAVAITPALVDLIDTADPHDPIALQFVPDERELETRPEETADPIGDEAHSPVPGVVHRYPDRVLLKLLIGLLKRRSNCSLSHPLLHFLDPEATVPHVLGTRFAPDRASSPSHLPPAPRKTCSGASAIAA